MNLQTFVAMSVRLGRRGVSVVELLVVVVIVLVIVSGVVLALTNASTQLWSRANSQMATSTGTYTASARIAEQLKRARNDSLRCWRLYDSIPILQFSKSGGNTVVLIYRNPNTNQLVRSDGGKAEVLSSGVTNFQASCRGGEQLVRIWLETQTGVLRGAATQTVLTEIRVLNPY